MTIHSTAVVSIYGGSGIMVDTASSINIAIDDGFVLGIGRILYHNLLGEIEDIEKRKKVNQYLKSHFEAHKYKTADSSFEANSIIFVSESYSGLATIFNQSLFKSN